MLFKLLRQQRTLLLLFQSFFIIELTIPQLTVAENSSSNSKDTIYFGFAEDSYPVSLSEEGGAFPDGTFCSQLYDYLSQIKINQKKYKLKAIPVPYEFRLRQNTIEYNGENIQLDINCGSISITPERITNYALDNLGHFFSISYFQTPSRYIIRNGENYDTLIATIKTGLSNIKSDGNIDIGEDKAIIVIEGTTQAKFVYDHFVYSNICFVPSQQDLYDLLENGSAEPEDCRERNKETDKEGITSKAYIVAHLNDDIMVKGILSRKSEIRKKYKYTSLTGEMESLGLVIYDQRIPKESDENYREIYTRNIFLARVVDYWIREEGEQWIVNKDQDLDGELKWKSFLDYLGANLKSITIIIITFILGGIVVYCFSIWQQNKSRKRSGSNLSTENKDEKQDASIITTIYNFITHLGDNNHQKFKNDGIITGSSTDQKLDNPTNKNSNEETS